MNLAFLSRLKTRDAALIFAYLQERKGYGAIGETSYERLAQELNTESLTTSRGANFTAAVIRSKLTELEDARAIETEKTSANGFSVFVFIPTDINEPVEIIEPKKIDLYNGRSLFDYENENENENATSEKSEAPIEEYINNKKINKRDCKSETRKSKRVPRVEPVEDNRPTTDEVKTRINWEDPKVANYRRQLVKKIWERGMNPDLIDRVAGIAILKIGGGSVKQVSSMIREAIEAYERFQRTDGKFGKSAIWKTLALSVKRIYEGAGWKWTPTTIANEPEPAADYVIGEPSETKSRDAEDVAPIDLNNLGYTFDEIAKPFEAFVRTVARREKLGAMEARGRAIILRNALRSVKNGAF